MAWEPAERLRNRVVTTALLLAAASAASTGCALSMPGESHRRPLPALTTTQASTAERLRDDVTYLAGAIGERNLVHPDQLRAAEHFLAASLAKAGHHVRWQTYTCRGHEVSNLEVEIPGTSTPDEIVVIGAHYDSINHNGRRTPGANDNASGTAAALELARRFASTSPARTLRFVLFVNEEPPYFWTDEMGSLVYARAAKARGENIVAMLSLETMGRYVDTPASQDYPPFVGLAYPSEGNFIAFVGMSSASDLVTRCVGTFRGAVDFPSEGAALPGLVPRVASSDHWSFWKQDYPALMVTDTAYYRDPNYHKPTDTPDQLDYERLARVVDGLYAVIADLASPPASAPPTHANASTTAQQVSTPQQETNTSLKSRGEPPRFSRMHPGFCSVTGFLRAFERPSCHNTRDGAS